MACWLTSVEERPGDGRCAIVSKPTPSPEIERAPDSSGGESPVLLALGSLRQRDQELLLLVAWDGLDRAQAAAVLGSRDGRAFSVRLHRARRQLERALAEQKAIERRAGDPPAMEVCDGGSDALEQLRREENPVP